MPEDGSAETCLITCKSQSTGGDISVRPSIDIHADPGELVPALWTALGFHETLRFEKRRETWRLDHCLVELDQLPVFGQFVEIEGPDEAAIRDVRTRLGLDGATVEKKTYLVMVRDHLAGRPELGGALRFG